MDSPSVSVICCYNNIKIFNDMLYKSVLNQTVPYEIIAIDNRKKRFKSAASALNYGAYNANGKYLVFAHQDIEINNDRYLESVIKYLVELSPSIIGIAGNKDNSGVYSNIKHGINHVYAGVNRVSSPVQVQTIDECFFAVERELFLKTKFDETVCNNWHLYAVDLCLSMGLDDVKSYVIPSPAFHKSSGLVNSGYYKTLNMLAKKHRNNYKTIYSTCSKVRTNIILYPFDKIMIPIKTFKQRNALK